MTIALNLPRYLAAKTREDKTEVILSVLKILREDAGARFIKKKGEQFIELSDARAREKVAHALRDLSVQNPTPLSSVLKRQSSSSTGAPTASSSSSSSTVSSKVDKQKISRSSGNLFQTMEQVFEIFSDGDQNDDDFSMEPIPIASAHTI